MLVEIIFFRHGETDWNALRKMQGHTDIPLNEKGKAQARDLATLLIEHKPEIILSSDLIRAKETAGIVNDQLGVTTVFSHHLREYHLGEAEGMHQDSLADLIGLDGIQKWISSLPEYDDFRFPRGESKRELSLRVFSHIHDFIALNSNYSKIAVSTHGGVIWQMIAKSLNAPAMITKLPNCAAILMEYHFDKRHLIFKKSLHA